MSDSCHMHPILPRAPGTIKARTHLALFGGLLALTIAPRLTWPNYFDRERQEVSGQASVRRAREIEADWKRLSYDAFSLPGTQRRILDKLDRGAAGLSDKQKAALQPRLSQLLRYLENPDFEEYYRLKAKGFHYTFAPTAVSSNILSLASHTPDRLLVADPKACSKVIWNAVHRYNGRTILPKITSVSLNTVAAAISHTNSGRVLLGGPVKNGFTIGREALEPGFQFGCDGNSAGAPLLFEFSFLAEANSSGNVGPMYVSLIWIEQDQNWALNRLVVDTWLGFQTIF